MNTAIKSAFRITKKVALFVMILCVLAGVLGGALVYALLNVIH